MFRQEILNEVLFIVPNRYVDLLPSQFGNAMEVIAFDQISERRVVIKKVVLPENFDNWQHWRRAQRELFCTLHIQEENFVKMYSIYTWVETVEEMREFYTVREYMDWNLRNFILSTPEKLDHKVIKSIFFDVCLAVQYMHSIRVGHRDLKPENVLINYEAIAKISGFAHANREDPFVNTPYIVQRFYRAPEILCETMDNNKPSVDIWSLGCILAELLTGKILFTGQTQIDQFFQIVRFLGNPDLSFYMQMPDSARTFFLGLPMNQYQKPTNIHEHFPNSLFLDTMISEPIDCDLARDLLFRMLVINPDDRIDIQKILVHPYLEEVWSNIVIDNKIEEKYPPIALRRFFEFQAFSPPRQMKDEIFSTLTEFGIR